MALFYHSVLALAVAWHLLSLAGITTGTEGIALYAPFVVIVGAFLIAAFTHPRTRFEGGLARITLQEAWQHLPLPLKAFGAVCAVYGVVATCVMIQVAKARLGVSRGVSSSELGTVGISAFALVFAALAWLAGLSGIRARERMG